MPNIININKSQSLFMGMYIEIDQRTHSPDQVRKNHYIHLNLWDCSSS